MSKLETLKSCTTKQALASLLGIKTRFLTHTLYVLRPETQYYQFKIAKKNGGERVISAPSEKLKLIQSKLSHLLLDCIDEFGPATLPSHMHKKKLGLAHGFVRDRSIITNAMMHLNKRFVLNIDLDNFFDSFNFGRVRGFFIKNRQFQLDPNIATLIAQIACYDNKLPQGSPCSPVISNLICHPLDIRLASLAEKYSCTYSRYADDITFSTRKSVFPPQIMHEDDEQYTAGKTLSSNIERAGFSINAAKTRIQYKDSRQDVTGLIANKKPNTKKEYWRTARIQCRFLFKTGYFTKNIDGNFVQGNINELEGQLNFIDQVDRYNRLRQHPSLNPVYALRKENQKFKKHSKVYLTGRERTLSQFLYYRLFYANEKPTVLCEGKTDNIHLKSAINQLAATYTRLATPKTLSSDYELLMRFVAYNERTKFLLELSGGVDYLKGFIEMFPKQYEFYRAPTPQNLVVIVLDNDKGPDGLL
ncbi:MAG: retron Ec67 family RNA-directed DNA polymerase/endonuclease, partial [Cellvibrionaceae bacterium]